VIINFQSNMQSTASYRIILTTFIKLCSHLRLRLRSSVSFSDKYFKRIYCHALVTVDGVLDWQLDLLDPDTITVTAYHNVHSSQQFSRTQHKAGNGSSACVPLQHSSGIPCHQFLTSPPKTNPLNLPTTPRKPTTTPQQLTNPLRGIWPLVEL
jgi:hypothetical protein